MMRSISRGVRGPGFGSMVWSALARSAASCRADRRFLLPPSSTREYRFWSCFRWGGPDLSGLFLPRLPERPNGRPPLAGGLVGLGALSAWHGLTAGAAKDPGCTTWGAALKGRRPPPAGAGAVVARTARAGLAVGRTAACLFFVFCCEEAPEKASPESRRTTGGVVAPISRANPEKGLLVQLVSITWLPSHRYGYTRSVLASNFHYARCIWTPPCPY